MIMNLLNLTDTTNYLTVQLMTLSYTTQQQQGWDNVLLCIEASVPINEVYEPVPTSQLLACAILCGVHGQLAV